MHNSAMFYEAWAHPLGNQMRAVAGTTPEEAWAQANISMDCFQFPRILDVGTDLKKLCDQDIMRDKMFDHGEDNVVLLADIVALENGTGGQQRKSRKK